MIQTEIFIIEQPIPIAPAYRPIRFKVYSNAPNKPELQIKGELYYRVTPASPWLIAVTKIERPYLGTIYFLFDFSEALQTLLTYDRLSATEHYIIQAPNNNSIIEYKAVFTEIYNNPSGFPAEYSTKASIVSLALNTTRQPGELPDMVEYTILGAGTVTMSFTQDFSIDFGF